MVALSAIVLVFVAAAVAVVVVAMARSKRSSEAAKAGSTGFLFALVIAICIAGIGLGVPLWLVIRDNTVVSHESVGGVKLAADQVEGRQLFAQNCATCHTLAGAAAVGKTGPDLDAMRPPEALTYNAIVTGRANGNGNMPAGLLTGQDAKEVASFVAAVAGRGDVASENASVAAP